MIPRTLITLLIASSGSLAGEGEVSFSRDVAPVLQQQCVGCHREGKAKGKYRIDSYQHAMRAVDAASPEDSELLKRITADDGDERMPADADPLPAAQVATIRRWIEQGARFDAEDPAAPLASLIPMQPHPAAPATYRHPVPIAAMAISADGKELFTGGYHEILVWDPQAGALRRRIPDNGQRTQDLALSPDGRLLAAATGSPGESGELRIFAAATGEVLATPVRTGDVATCVAFRPDGAQLAFGAADGKLRIFDTATWEVAFTIAAHSDLISDLAWDPEGNRIATAGRDKVAKVFDLTAAGKRLVTFSGHAEAVRGVAFHPGGDEVISCGDQGLLLRWKIADAKKSADLADFGEPASRLVATAAGYFVAAGARATQFAVADQARGREFALAAAEDDLLCECLVHGGQLFAGTSHGRVLRFDLASGELSASFLAVPTIEPAALESQPAAENWPSFRGPGASGVLDGQALPDEWDAASDPRAGAFEPMGVRSRGKPEL